MKHSTHFLVLAISISTFYVTCGKHYSHAPQPTCTCTCPFNKLTVCETVEELRSIADANTEQLKIWAGYRQFVQHFSERWQEEIADIVETTIKDYVSKGKLHQRPENLVKILEDGMLSDSTAIPRPAEDDADLVRNVSSLLEKVEMVENRTKEVENELKTERRVRRDLEEKVNKTHTSLVFIEDQLQNVSVPVDAMVTQVEMKLYATIEDLNKTIYEDHLKKLYYKVDGVVYKNETKQLDERLETVETELQDQSNSSVVSKLAEDLKNLEGSMYLLNNSVAGVVVPSLRTLNSSVGDILLPRLETLETETVRKDAAEVLESKMADLLNETEVFKTALVDVLSSVQDVQNLEEKFQNFSDHLSKSLEVMQRQIESLRNETAVKNVVEDSFNESYTEDPSASNVSGGVQTEHSLGNSSELARTEATVEQNVASGAEFGTTVEIATTTELQTFDLVKFGTTAEEFTTSENYGTKTSDRSRMDKYLEEDFAPCDVPVIDDRHLLVDVVRNEEGKQTLRFGCRPIGSFVLNPVPVPPRCEKGAWKGPMPSCIWLPNVLYIERLSEKLQKENPCNAGYGEFPDPTNCTRFFKCAPGRFTIVPCPLGLRFNPLLKVCDHPRTTECYSERSETIEQLMRLTPTIRISPDNLDRPNGLLATSSRGELIVHPRSRFALQCVYPENVFGSPEWKVDYLHAGANSSALTRKGIGAVTLMVMSAKEEDSGTYSCFTPFGPKHDIEVLVKAVICPAFPEDDHEDIFYRPTPEGELRILGTTAEIQCEEGHKIVAQCMGNGSWSRAFPSKEECTPKKRKDETPWNCPPLDFRKNPDLIMERRDPERIITFKCAGRKRLVGNTFIRCLDDGFWSHTYLPTCKA